MSYSLHSMRLHTGMPKYVVTPKQKLFGNLLLARKFAYFISAGEKWYSNITFGVLFDMI